MATKNIIYTIYSAHDSVSLSNHAHSTHNANFDKNTRNIAKFRQSCKRSAVIVKE